LQTFGYKIINIEKEQLSLPADFEKDHLEIISIVKDYTMTSTIRIFSLIEALKYIEKNNIEGDIIECGVWKGGSMMVVCEVMKRLGNQSRKLYLYDTFEGMVEPEAVDLNIENQSAQKMWNNEKDSCWCYSSLEEVKNNIDKIGYDKEKITYIKGKVEDTVPHEGMSNKIALLRLDTDWYNSTKHELEYFFPLLVKNGILIIDDYGYWQGAKKAVDEYFGKHNIFPLLNRLDETGRIYIKQ
jgi:O-methyltransferase